MIFGLSGHTSWPAQSHRPETPPLLFRQQRYNRVPYGRNLDRCSTSCCWHHCCSSADSRVQDDPSHHMCSTRCVDWRMVQIVQRYLCSPGTCGPPPHICSTCEILHDDPIPHFHLLDSPWTNGRSGCSCSMNGCLWLLFPQCSHKTGVQVCRSCSKIQQICHHRFHLVLLLHLLSGHHEVLLQAPCTRERSAQIFHT